MELSSHRLVFVILDFFSLNESMDRFYFIF